MTQTDQKNVPKLRFLEFEESHSTRLQFKSFAELFAFSSGKNIKQDEASPNYNTPCVRYGELYHMYGEVITKVINKTNLPRSELTFSEGNEILLPSAGEDPFDISSASALTVSGVAIGRTINVLKPLDPNVCSHIFVSYYINAKLRKRISCLARGSSISNVYNSDLQTLKIYLPTLPEQRKIAGFLGAVDTKIAQLAEKKRLLEDYKKGCMQQLFSQKIRFKDDTGNSFLDWEEKRLGEVFEERSERGNPDAELLSVTLNQGVVRASDVDRATSASADRSNYKLVRVGDIAYNSMRMWQGASGSSQFEGIVSPAYTVTTPIYGQISEFWGYYFKLRRTFHTFERYSQGLTSDTWNLKFPAFSKIKLNIPHPDEQRKIADFLAALDRKIDLVGQELTHARSFKQGLLQQMFV